MISPFTPPGTKVVCIIASKPPGERVALVEGHVYTIRGWSDFAISGPNGTCENGVYLEEIRNAMDPKGGGELTYNRQRFRLASLPSCLTDCLTSAPVDQVPA